MRRTIAVLFGCAALATAAAVASGEESSTEPGKAEPQGRCTASQHKDMLKQYRAHTGPTAGRVVFAETHYIPKRAKQRHRNILRCAQDRDTEKAMVHQWRSAKREHGQFKRAVLAYHGGRNPIGSNRWALPYYIVVCESGAGSGSSNYYGMLQGWAYRAPFTTESAWGAPFWDQSIAVYNLRQHGFGGWECA